MNSFACTLLIAVLSLTLPSPAHSQVNPGSPGTHTIVLRPNHGFINKTTRAYRDVPFFGVFMHRNLDCTRGMKSSSYLNGNGAGLVIESGWGQVRGDGHPGSSKDPCLAWVTEAAIDFDMSPLRSIGAMTFVQRAVLSYREREAASCMTLVYTQGGFLVDPLPCYTSVRGDREAKPTGCLVLAVPPENWVAYPLNRRLETLPNMNFARLATGSWDVTSLVQNRANAGLGRSISDYGHGFMLVGAPIIVRRLPAEDNSRCSSFVSDIGLTVTYTVPQQSRPHPPPK